MVNNSPLSAYVSTKSNSVSGWFSRIDAELFQCLLEYQNIKSLSGSVAEIGVHQGRSFIAMCLALQRAEKAYCVDIFEAQHLNKDSSGCGAKAVFEKNLAKFGIDSARVTIASKSSQVVTPREIIDSVGLVRFFSVDGGHWHEIVKSDLKLAELTLADYGIIALDDFHRPEWPDVSAGYFSWHSERIKPLVPFVIGFNKLYLCDERYAIEYGQAVASNKFLANFFSKTVEFQRVKVPVYQHYILPEEDMKSRLRSFAKLFYPDLLVRTRVWRKKFQG